MILRQTQNSIYNRSSKCPEIGCAGKEFYFACPVNDFVKHIFQLTDKLSFLTLLLICCNTVKFFIILKNLHHSGNCFRSLLQICINHRYKISCCFLKSGINCGFFSKISGESFHDNTCFVKIKYAL